METSSQGLAWHAIYKINHNHERIRPVFDRHLGMSKQRHSCFHYVTVSSFRNAVVFRGVWWTGEMLNPMISKKRSETSVLTTIIRVEGFDFRTELILHQRFECRKEMDNLRL